MASENVKRSRHKWLKLRRHVYICRKCGTGRVNSLEDGHWLTTFHLPNGESRMAMHTPSCEVGQHTERYLAERPVLRSRETRFFQQGTFARF